MVARHIQLALILWFSLIKLSRNQVSLTCENQVIVWVECKKKRTSKDECIMNRLQACSDDSLSALKASHSFILSFFLSKITWAAPLQIRGGRSAGAWKEKFTLVSILSLLGKMRERERETVWRQRRCWYEWEMLHLWAQTGVMCKLMRHGLIYGDMCEEETLG